MLLLGVVFALVVAIPVTVAFRPVPRRVVDTFVARYPVPRSAATGSLVLRYLARVRSARALGGLGGLLLAIAFGLTRTHGRAADLLFMVPAGYFAGSLIAEIPTARPRLSRSGVTASLSARRLDLYVARWMVWAPVAILGGLLVFDVAALLLPVKPAHADGGIGAASTVAACGIVALVAVMSTAAVRRPQPIASPELVYADDQLRAASIHNLCGCGLALVSDLASAGLFQIATATDDLALAVLAFLAALLTGIFAYFVWFSARIGPWVVRRPYAQLLAPLR